MAYSPGGSCSMAAWRSRSTWAGAVVAVKGVELVEDVMAVADAGMVKDLPAGDHLEGDATEAQAHPDVAIARVLALSGPARRQSLKVVVAKDEVVGDAE